MVGTVRKAKMKDLPRIEEIYACARSFMRQTGNPNQWGSNYPPYEQLRKDIEAGDLFLIEDICRIHGVFYFRIGLDPTYDKIYDGSWRVDSRYGVIHRIAGDGTGGILKTAVAYGLSQIDHIRIDTHHENYVMQNALHRLGFERRGIIYIEDGTSRIAFDKLISK